MSSGGKKDWRTIGHAQGCIKEEEGVEQEQAGRLCTHRQGCEYCPKSRVAVVDQHPNFCLFSITTTNRVALFPLNIIYFNQILSLLSIQLLPYQHGFQQRSERVTFVSKLCKIFFSLSRKPCILTHVLWISKPVDSRSLSIIQQHAGMRHLHLLRGMLRI